MNLSNLTYEFILHTCVYTRVYKQKTSMHNPRGCTCSLPIVTAPDVHVDSKDRKSLSTH